MGNDAAAFGVAFWFVVAALFVASAACFGVAASATGPTTVGIRTGVMTERLRTGVMTERLRTGEMTERVRGEALVVSTR